MSSKRQATSELNHDNWNDEEEPEERGEFRTAPPDELKNRVIKKARRKLAGTATSSDSPDSNITTKSVFSGFSGFAQTTTGATPFSFLSNIPAASTSTGISSTVPTLSFSSNESKKIKTTAIAEPSKLSIGSDPLINTPQKSENTSISVTTTTTINTSPSNTNKIKVVKSNDYCAKLMGLNQTVSSWIKKFVDENPICILSPIFKDYEEHLKKIEADENEAATKQIVETIDDNKAELTNALIKQPSQSEAFDNTQLNSTKSEDKIPSAIITSPASIVAAAPTVTKSTFALPTSTTSSSSPSKAPIFSTIATTTPTVAKSVFALPTSTSSSPTPPKATIHNPTGTISTPAATDCVVTTSTTTTTTTSTSTTLKTNGFTFGTKSDDKPSTSIFSFSKTSDDYSKPSTSGFSFTPGAKPFSFGNIAPPASACTPSNSEQVKDEDDDDKPPKVEFKQVVEDDAIYSKKCKVFVKKEGDFRDRGIGMLYLKPINETGKTQLLVRADTNLGNILVNLILTSGIPCQRMGKNNVMLLCMPTPEEKATSLLLRVKTTEDAEELHQTIEKNKK